MPVRRLRLLAAIAAIVLGGVLVAAFAGPDRDPSPRRADPHGDPGLSAADSRRLLNATAAASTDTPQAELVADGRRLFRSGAVAKTGESCQSCHTDGAANAELGTIPHPRFAGDFKGLRDPPSLFGVDRTAPYFWIGDRRTLRETVIGTIVDHFKEGETQPASTTGGQAAALVAYLSTLRAPRTRFDAGTMPPAAQRGLRVFQTKGDCSACHGGPDFTDNRLHDTLVPQGRPGDDDPGAPSPRGAFNTPMLRDVRNSAPYMHNGTLGSLRDVIEFYDQRSSVAPLNLTSQEIDDLVAFLGEL
jgi:cytochrome c peroxidase